MPLAVVGEGGCGFQQVVDYRDMTAQNGEILVQGLHVGIGYIGIVERLKVVKHLFQIAQPFLADRIGNPVCKVLHLLVLNGVQEGALFGEV